MTDRERLDFLSAFGEEFYAALAPETSGRETPQR
jgi:hypothetical protein